MTLRTKSLLGIAIVGVGAGVLWAGFGGAGVRKDQLIGTWTLISGGGGGGTTLTFDEDGKIKTSMKWNRETYDSEGTYIVKSDMIEMVIPESDWGNWSGKDDDWEKWDGKDNGYRSEKGEGNGKTTKKDLTSQNEPKLQRATIKSLSGNELVLVDEHGRKSIYARK